MRIRRSSRKPRGERARGEPAGSMERPPGRRRVITETTTVTTIGITRDITEGEERRRERGEEEEGDVGPALDLQDAAAAAATPTLSGSRHVTPVAIGAAAAPEEATAGTAITTAIAATAGAGLAIPRTAVVLWAAVARATAAARSTAPKSSGRRTECAES